MPSDGTFDFSSLSPEYLDAALRGLQFDRKYSPRHPAWRRIPLDLMPLRWCQMNDAEGNCLATKYWVRPGDLAVAICEGLGERDCGYDGEERVARWIKCRIAIKRRAMEIK